MANSFELGEWVNSEPGGFFRIEKIIQEYYDESEEAIEGKNIGDKYDKKVILLKKLLNCNYEKSLDYKFCNETLISKLTFKEQETLKSILEKNHDLMEEIDNYVIPPIKRYRSIMLKIELPKDVEKINLLISFISFGKTFIEIMEKMAVLGIAESSGNYFGSHHLNLTNYDFQCTNQQRIWSEAKLFTFNNER